VTLFICHLLCPPLLPRLRRLAQLCFWLVLFSFTNAQSFLRRLVRRVLFVLPFDRELMPVSPLLSPRLPPDFFPVFFGFFEATELLAGHLFLCYPQLSRGLLVCIKRAALCPLFFFVFCPRIKSSFHFWWF